MNFLKWYYSEGIALYLRNLGFYLAWLAHYFTFPLLLKSFFSPWKRLIDTNENRGFNFKRYFEQLSFNIISRTIGAIVRMGLFWSGVLLLVISALMGSIGFIVWVIFPPFGYALYLKHSKDPRLIVGQIVKKIKSDPTNANDIIFSSWPGLYVLEHLGLAKNELGDNLNQIDVSKVDNIKTFEELMRIFVESNPKLEETLKRKWISLLDFRYAGAWWDRMEKEKSSTDVELKFGRPGIGLELLFGYTPELNRVSSDLSRPQPYSHHWIGRAGVVERIERILESGKSVVITGMPGVGKKTVVLEFARRAAWGELGATMSYKRVLEFDYNAILSQTSDLNSKKTKMSNILKEAAYAGNVILVIPDLQKLTNRLAEGYDFTEIFEENMEGRELKIIALTSNSDYERFIAPNLRLRKNFDVIQVTAPNKEEALLITTIAAEKWERSKRVVITVPALRRIIDATDKYITEAPFPEKALDLLDELVTFASSQKLPTITVEVVNTVLSEKTGIPFTRLTESEKDKLSNLEEIIHKKLIDQSTAVSLISKSLRARSVGVKSDERPIGSFLFLGPTGVGKTQTAKVLSEVYYGVGAPILRFDMAEYLGSDGIARLIGSAVLNQPGTLTTAIKNKPASLLLLDEIEKASPEIANIFLTLLDEGYITDAFGRRVDCRHLFVIATSNAGAEFVRQKVKEGISGLDLQRDVFNYIQSERIFSPEFINRFDGVVVYEPLSRQSLKEVAKIILEELSENLKKQNIYLEVTDELAEKVAEDGFSPEYGARPMRRVVDLSIGDIISKGILQKGLVEGDRIKVIPEGDKYSIQKIA